MLHKTLIFKTDFIRLLMLIFLSTCLTFNLQAQNQKNIDSFQIVLKTTKQDTTKIKAYVDLSWEYRHSIPDTAMYYGKTGLQLATKINFIKGIALCYNGIGVVQESLGNYSQALESFQKSLKIHEDIGNKKGMSDCYVNIGFIYGEQGNYNQTLDYLLKALKILEELGLKKEMANVYVNIGTVHGISGNYAKALEYFKQALKICEENGYKQLSAECYTSIGNIYNEQSNYLQAIEYYQKALKLDVVFGEKKHISICYNNIGCAMEKQGNYPMALDYEQKALKIRKEIGDKNGISTGLTGIGSIYCKMGNYKEAITYSTNGLEYAKKIGSLLCESDAYETLSESYKGIGDYKNALKNHELFKQVNDTIFNQDKNSQIAKMEALYQSNKKQKEIEIQEVQLSKNEIEIKHQKTLKLSFIIGFVLVVMLAFIIFRGLQWKKRDNKIITAEKAKSEELLRNILPFETVEELKKYGHSDARHYDMVSVLFTDFKGFSTFAENLPASKLIAELDLCFRAFDQIISKYNIEKIKTIGDSYMCAGGVPLPNNTNAIEVVNCGLEILQYMDTYKEERIKKNELYFEIRIGIHTGPIVAGIVGLKKYSYDIWGDTVNTASRMESSGEVGKVNISGATYELVKDDFICTHRGKIQAKNKGEIDMYFVEGIISK